MGSGETCHQRLSAKTTASYMADHGLEMKDPQLATVYLGGAIAEVCRSGPATMSVDDGAEKVADLLKSRL
jgi:hypothetical protein